MKRLFSILTLIIVLYSCSSDVKFNSPGFQARKDNFNWRASSAIGKIVNNQLIIEAFVGNEQVTLTIDAPTASISSGTPVIYKFGITTLFPLNNNEAVFKSTVKGQVTTYKTNTTQSNGQLEITSYDLTTKVLSGKFRFNATLQPVANSTLDASVTTNVNFQEGFIFNVVIN